MDLIKINDNKLKIMLTPRDMAGYALDADTMDCSRRETRQAMRSILDDVKSRIGFDASGNKIYIQLYPSRGGGCEMFVTKLGIFCSVREPSERSPLSATGRVAITPKTRVAAGEESEHSRASAFLFETLDSLLCVCRRLRDCVYTGESAAFHGEEGNYYLLLTDPTEGRRPTFPRGTPFQFIFEYGTEQNAEAVRLYIREHAKPICERDAVERLAPL